MRPLLQSWELQDAKNRLDEVVKQAFEDGPQSLRIDGQPAAVVLSMRDLKALIKPRMSFTDFLLVDTPDTPLWPNDVVDAINATRSF